MGRTIIAAGIAILATTLATPAEAQISFGFGNSSGGGVVTVGGGRGIRGGVAFNNGNGFNGNVVIGGGGFPSQPVRPRRPRRPSQPVVVTPHQVVAYNPWNGAVHTHNNQINNTAFDFGRNASRNNGTRRVVNRPVRDQFGNVVGFEQGVVWNNSLTGQEHGETQVTTTNGTGGSSSTTTVFRSAAPTQTQTTNVSYTPMFNGRP